MTRNYFDIIKRHYLHVTIQTDPPHSRPTAGNVTWFVFPMLTGGMWSDQCTTLEAAIDSCIERNELSETGDICE